MAGTSVVSYLHKRELGAVRKRFCQTSVDVESFLEDKAARSTINQACSLSGPACRATFLMEFSPDGTQVASTHGDHHVRVTDIATGKCIRTLHGHPRTPWCLAYHPSSSHILASGCLAGQVRIWDLYGHGCEVWQTEKTSVIASMTFHPVEHVLVFAAGHTIYFWDWNKPEPFAKCETTHHVFERIRWVKFDSLGHHLYTGISNNTTHQGETVSQESTRAGTSEPHPVTARRRPRLVNIYNNLLNCFQEYNSDRVLQQVQPPSQQGSGPSTGAGSQPPGSIDPSGADSQQAGRGEYQDLVEEPHSPVHEEGLSFARQYAFHVTDNADHRVHGARSYASMVSRSSLNSDRQTVEPILGVWSPAPHPLAEQHDIQVIDSTDPLGFQQDLANSVDLESLHDTHNTFSLITDRAGGCGMPGTGQSRVALNAQLNSESRCEGTSNSNGVANNNFQVTVSASYSCNSNSGNTAVTCVSDSCNTPVTSILGSGNLPVTSVPTSSSSVATGVSCSSDSAVLNEPSSTTHCTCATVTPGNVPVTSPAVYPMLTRFLRDQNTHPQSCPQSSASATGANCRDNRTVTVVAANCSQQVTSVTSGTSSTRSESQPAPRVRIIRPGDSAAVHVEARNCDFNEHGVRILPAQTTATERGNRAGLTGLFNQLTSQVPTVVASTSSYTSLFQNVYNQSVPSGPRHRPDTGHSLLGRGHQAPISSVRSQPYYHNRTRLSSMSHPHPGAPYLSNYTRLQNTMTNQQNPSEITIRRGEILSVDRVRDEVVSGGSATLRISVSQAGYGANTATVSRSTSTEVSSHLSSGAYFRPISEDPRQSHSSTSTESVSSVELGPDLLLARQSADSQRSDTSAAGSVETTALFSSNQRGGDVELATSAESQVNVPSPESDGGNIAGAGPVPIPQHIRLQNQDNNNNTIHLLDNSDDGAQSGTQAFEALRDNFVSMTDRIEREMGELNRRISALRESFNESLLALRQDRERYRSIGGESGPQMSGPSLRARRVDGGPRQQAAPVITISYLEEPRTAGQTHNESVSEGAAVTESQPHSQLEGTAMIASQPQTMLEGPSVIVSQPRTLLESSLRSHHRGRQFRYASSGLPLNTCDRREVTQPCSRTGATGERQHWRTLQRHYLHPHYSSSILDDTINRPNNAIQAAINRAIAGAFMGNGEPAVASNIINQTHRIQYWDFTHYNIPDITAATVNIVVPHCKLHNDASCDISRDGTLLATFVPSPRGFPDDNILAVYSLEPQTRGQCLYTKSFGPNAISVSISPRNQYVLIGLAAKQLSWMFTANQLVAQVFKLEKPHAGENSMEHVSDTLHPCNMDIRSHVGVNSARWLPLPGQGLVYGTNKGDLHLCTPGVKVAVEKVGGDSSVTDPQDSSQEGTTIRRNLMHMLGLSNADFPRTINISTQTSTRGVRRSASTQTDNSDSE